MTYNGILNFFIDLANSVIDVISNILPGSPFARYLQFSQNVPILQMLNYFVPIGAYVTITLTWANALLFFYGRAIVMRWVKILKG